MPPTIPTADEFLEHLPPKDWMQALCSRTFPYKGLALGHAQREILADQAQHFLRKGRATLAAKRLSLGLLLDESSFVKHIRRQGLLRCSRYEYRGDALIQLLALCASVPDLRASTKDYLASIRALLSLASEVNDLYLRINASIASKSRHVLKTLVAMVDALFLLGHESNPGAYPSDDLHHFSIERLAEALSYSLHVFRKNRGIDDTVLNYIDELSLRTGYYEQLLIDMCILKQFNETEILVDSFSYRATRDGNDVVVSAPSALLEKAIRFGYVQTDLQNHIANVKNVTEKYKDAFALSDLAQRIFDKSQDKIIDYVESPVPRYRLLLPNHPDLFSPFREDSVFREDLAYIDAACKSQYAPMELLLNTQVRNSLTVFDVVKVQRLLNFMRQLMAQKLTPLFESDMELALRSLVPVFRKQQLHDLLGNVIQSDRVQDFIQLFAHGGDQTGVWDIQYQPIIQTPDYYLMPLNILASSNLLRNVLYMEGTKVTSALPFDPMQRALAGVLRTRIGRVAENVKLEHDGKAIELDVVASAEGVLFIFECKNSFHPCGIHELRTSYGHIIRASEQLSAAKALLSSVPVQKKLFDKLGWPLGDRQTVRTCIVTGNRMFNGYQTDDQHPVRQLYELFNLLAAGTIGGGAGTLRIWKGEEFTIQDLIAHLDGTTTHKDAFDSMEQCLLKYRIGDDKCLVIDTYSLNLQTLHEISMKRYPVVHKDGKDGAVSAVD